MDFLQFGPSLSPVPLPSFAFPANYSLPCCAVHHSLLQTSVLPMPVILPFLTACTRKAAVGFISGVKAEC